MGIFTKKDTNTISGEDKYKGWGNSKEKVFETEAQKRAVEGMAGGDLKGKDFRKFKRSVHKQKRLNRRALRRAERKGIDPSQVKMRGGEYKELGRREQAVEDYFKDLRKERVENTAEITAVVAGTILTAGALGAFAPAAAGAGAATGAGGAAAAGGATAAGAGAAGAGTAAATTAATTAGTTAATSAGTTAATTGFKAAAKQFGKKAAQGAIKKVASNALSSGGAQGAVNSNPVNLPPQQGTPDYMSQYMMQQQQFSMPPQYDQQPVYTMPESLTTPSYTAAQVYDPFA